MSELNNNNFKNDVKSLKRDNLHLKLRVQQAENEINVIKQDNINLKLRVQQAENKIDRFKKMVTISFTDSENIYNEKAVIIQSFFKEVLRVKRVHKFRSLYLCFKSIEMNYLQNIKRRRNNTKLLSTADNIWYMNGNAEDIEIWDIFVKNGILLTWNHQGRNEQIKNKLKKDDIIAWYIVGKGFNSIVKVLDSPTVMKPCDLAEYYPEWKDKYGTLENWSKHQNDEKYERIAIKVEFLATTDKHFINDCIEGWVNNWTKGLRGSHCMKPTSIHWREQVITMYDYLDKK